MRRSRLFIGVLAYWIIGCGASDAVAPPPPAPSAVPAPPVPLEIDSLPGSIAELEAIASDPSSGERGLASLEKMAAILHAESAFAPDSTEPAATLALRRVYARASNSHDEERRARVAPTLIAALDASSALAEADALRRNLACPSRFVYAPSAEGSPAPIDALPQDHAEEYWRKWEDAHWAPLDAPQWKRGQSGFVALPDGPATSDADTHYVALYSECPDDANAAHAESRAKAWVEVARAHRTRDARGGPFAVLRAIEAYQKAIHAAASVPHGASMQHAHFELGDALHAHQRYHAAAGELTTALTICEDTHACAAADREAALATLADSLTRDDYEGPPADAPVIERADLFDQEGRQEVLLQKLRVAIDRAVDPALVPKERAFAPEVLAAVAQVFDDVNLQDGAILAFDAFRLHFPVHRELPRVLQAIAREHVMAVRYLRARDAAARWARAVAAWDDLTALLAPGSSWRAANAKDSAALAEANLRAHDAEGELATTLWSFAGALERAANQEGALPTSDAAAHALFLRAIETWKARAKAGGPDASTARAAIAAISKSELTWDARVGTEIDPARFVSAWNAALAARDDTDNAKDRAAAARVVVDVADLHVAYDEKQFVKTHGARGFAARSHALQMPLRVRAEEALPSAIDDAVKARDAVAIDTTPLSNNAAIDALKGAAGILFAYGHTKEAQMRMTSALTRSCKLRGGFDTFTLAAELARAAHDNVELARLAALHVDPNGTCATTPNEIAKGKSLTR